MKKKYNRTKLRRFFSVNDKLVEQSIDTSFFVLLLFTLFFWFNGKTFHIKIEMSDLKWFTAMNVTISEMFATCFLIPWKHRQFIDSFMFRLLFILFIRLNPKLYIDLIC